jgi:hypothetical protein
MEIYTAAADGQRAGTEHASMRSCVITPLPYVLHARAAISPYFIEYPAMNELAFSLSAINSQFTFSAALFAQTALT